MTISVSYCALAERKEARVFFGVVAAVDVAGTTAFVAVVVETDQRLASTFFLGKRTRWH